MRVGEWLRSGEQIEGIDGRAAFVRASGSRGTPRLVLHGFPTTSYDFEPLVARWGDARVVAFDFHGFGASEPPRRWSYETQVALIERVARHAALTRAIVVAHDYGVSAAQELLARAREGSLGFELAGVVFLNGGLNPALHRALPIQRLLASPLGRVIAPVAVTRRTFSRGVRRVLARPERFDEDEHWAAVRDQVRFAHHQLHYIAERRAYAARWSDALVGATCPIAFAWGERDPVSGAHVLAWLRETLPGPEVLALDVGHWPQLEAPDEVAAFVDAFASRVG